MAAVDTNVLVRLLVRDDVAQAERAAAFLARCIEAGEPVFVPLTVVLELEWVLRSRYGLDREEILSVLAMLLETRELEFQDEATVERTVHAHRGGRADFAECLHLGATLTAGRVPLVTFDRHAARLEGVELL